MKYLRMIIPVVLVGLLLLLEPFYALDSYVCDVLYQDMTGTEPSIRIIAVDEETLTEYGNFNNWSRVKATELVKLLNEDKSTAPTLVAFDFLFMGETDRETDGELAKACADAGNVIVASNLVYRGSTKYAGNGELYYDTWNVEAEEVPYPSLNEAAPSGYANAQVAKDGRVRYAQLYTDTPSGMRNSFAYEIYSEYQEKIDDKVETPLTDAKNQICFLYSGRPSEVQHVSMKDVLNGKIDRSEFDDCIVLVGAYAPGFQDSYYVPADRGQKMYGVEIHANIIQALMQQKTTLPISKGVHAMIGMILICLMVLITKKQKLLPGIATCMIVWVLHMVIGRLLAVNYGIAITQVYVLFVIIGFSVYLVVEKYLLEKMKRRKAMTTFQKYMAPQVIKKLGADDNYDITLGGEKRQVAVLFVDIRGFTTMSESLMPEQVVSVLNEYLKLTTESILRHDGMLDKFIGDATMAVFNAPFDLDDYVYKAVLSAWDMKRGTENLAKSIKEKYGKDVSFGIGIHIGDAVVGNIGCEFRMDYTAIGDTVNTASRLEGKAKAGQILISEAVKRNLEGKVETEFVDEMALKGKSEKVPVYSVTSINV